MDQPVGTHRRDSKMSWQTRMSMQAENISIITHVTEMLAPTACTH
jgi:hypothetical protein